MSLLLQCYAVVAEILHLVLLFDHHVVGGHVRFVALHEKNELVGYFVHGFLECEPETSFTLVNERGELACECVCGDYFRFSLAAASAYFVAEAAS